MANNWDTFKIDNLLPQEVRSVVDAVTSITGALNGILSITKTALEVVKNLASTASANPLETVINQTVTELEGFIDGLTAETTAHAIMIPIQKQYYGRGERIPADKVPPDQSISSSAALEEDGGFPLREPDTSTIQFINESATATGGNQGFWKAVSVSLLDNGDDNKPEFPSDFAVGGVCLIFGASNYSELQENFDLFEQLLETGNRATLSSNTRPVAKNVRTKAVPILGTTSQVGVQVEWDAVPPVVGIPLFSDEQLVITEVFVIRSSDPLFREQFNWNQAFSVQPTNSLSDLLEEGENKVIARLRNDGVIRRYIDTDEHLEEEKIYFYGLALRYTIDDVVQPMGNISNVVRTVFTRRTQSTRRSVAPDWWATPSLIALFPDLERLINTVRLEVAGIGSRTSSNSGINTIIEQTITQIDLLLTQGEELLARIEKTTGKITALSTKQLAATSATTFSVSTGGMTAWMGELANRLSDETDTTRPPFDEDELVAGVVIVAGAPSIPQLQAFMTLLGLFFGASAANPILDAVNAVEVVTRSAETLVFDQSMTATRTETPAVVSDPGVLFDTAMNPTDTVACD